MEKRRKLAISACMPVYNGEAVIKETLLSILSQSDENFELIIGDDNSSDDTCKIVSEIKDDRIKLFRFDKNVGYPLNLRRTFSKCSKDIIFLIGQDDLIAPGTLEHVTRIFEENPNVGAITRPYYWYHDNSEKPVRAKSQFDSKRDTTINIGFDFNSIVKVFQTLDQLSGLAFRREFVDEEIHEDVFTAHVYPFVSIFKKHDIVYLKDYVIAVRISSSQTRHISSIYRKSPMQSWIDMFNTVLFEEKFDALREHCIKNFVAKNFVGLVQIKNYGTTPWLRREIKMLIKYNRWNLVDPRFWFFSCGTLILPSGVLVPLVDFFKENILSKFLKTVQPIKVEKNSSLKIM